MDRRQVLEEGFNCVVNVFFGKKRFARCVADSVAYRTVIDKQLLDDLRNDPLAKHCIVKEQRLSEPQNARGYAGDIVDEVAERA